MSAKDTLTSAIEQVPTGLSSLLVRMINEQNSRADKLEQSIRESHKEHKETIGALTEGQNKLVTAMDKLSSHVIYFEERHAKDLARIEERHEENRSKFDVVNTNYNKLLDKVEAHRDSIFREIGYIKSYMSAQTERDKTQESRWKSLVAIFSGVFITVAGALITAIIISMK